MSNSAECSTCRCTPKACAGGTRQIASLREQYALRVAPEARGSLASPQDGDGVLMVARGARRVRRYHLGVWAGIGGVAHVLHCQDGAGSILHPIRDLSLRALELEGIYPKSRSWFEG